MATMQCQFSSSLIPPTALFHLQNQQFGFSNHANPNMKSARKRFSLKVQAVKIPAGVEVPKVEPKLQAPFLGFTKNAEIWNSRVCMIGLIGIFIVELIFNKGILQIIGVDVGKGLDIPL